MFKSKLCTLSNCKLLSSLKSKLLKRLLLFTLLPTLGGLLAINVVTSLNKGEIVKSSEVLTSDLVLSSWIQLSDSHFSKTTIDSQAITRDRNTTKALNKNDREALSESVTPTYNRLQASHIVDSLYIYNKKAEMIFEAGHPASQKLLPFISQALNENTPVPFSFYNQSESLLEFVYAFPVYYRGKIKGVAVYVKDVSPLLKQLSEINGLGYGISYQKNLIFNNYDFESELLTFGQKDISSGEKKYSIIQTKIDVGNTDQVYLHLAKENTKSIEKLALYNTLSLVAVPLVLLAILASLVIILTRITSVLSRCSDSMIQLSNQKFDLDIPKYERADEIGKIINTLTILRDRLADASMLEEEQKTEQAAQLERAKKLGNTVEVFEDKAKDIASLLSSSSSELQDASKMLEDSVSSSDTLSEKVSQLSSSALQNVDAVAAASQEMTASIDEISQQSTKTQEIIEDTVIKTDEAKDNTEALELAAEEIGGIIKMIQDIANQTNLLALNATIEASRAGEAGRGFAVVANEVKELASETTSATGQIAENISRIQQVSKSVTNSISDVKNSISEVSHLSSTVASAVVEQTSVTGEIAQNMQSASDGVSQISESIGQVSNAIQEVKIVADNVSFSSSTISNQAMGLDQEVKAFCKNVNEI